LFDLTNPGAIFKSSLNSGMIKLAGTPKNGLEKSQTPRNKSFKEDSKLVTVGRTMS